MIRGVLHDLETVMTVAITRQDVSAGDLRAAAARTSDAKMARRMLALALVWSHHGRWSAISSM